MSPVSFQSGQKRLTSIGSNIENLVDPRRTRANFQRAGMDLSYDDPFLFENFYDYFFRYKIILQCTTWYEMENNHGWRVQFSLEKCNMGVSSPPTWEKNGSIQMGLPKKGFYDVSDWKYK